MPAEARSPLPGGNSPRVAGTELVGPVDPDQRLEVSVMVRPRQPLGELDDDLDKVARGERPYLSREEFAARYGADPADLASVEDFARQHGLEVVEANAARRTVRLAGRAADFGPAFGITLNEYRPPQRSTYRGYEGQISVPTLLQGIVEGVFGLDDRPVATREST